MVAVKVVVGSSPDSVTVEVQGVSRRPNFAATILRKVAVKAEVGSSQDAGGYKVPKLHFDLS